MQIVKNAVQRPREAYFINEDGTRALQIKTFMENVMVLSYGAKSVEKVRECLR